MMATSEVDNQPVLPYVLCGVTGAAFMFNLILLVWHVTKVKATHWQRYIRYSLLGIDSAYLLASISLCLLILYKDLHTDALCRAGGTLILIATLESVCMLAALGLSTLLWVQHWKPWKPRPQFILRVPHWVNSVFWFILVVQLVLVCLISILPQTGVSYFDSIHTDHEGYYLCTPLRLPWSQSWPYSALVISLHWIAMALLAGSFLAGITIFWKRTRQKKRSKLKYLLWMDPSRNTKDEIDAFGVMLSVTFTILSSFLCWLPILLVTTLSFAGRGAMDKDGVKWGLGFCIAITLMIHPLMVLCGSTLLRTSWISRLRMRWMRNEDAFDCPKTLHSLKKYQEQQPTDGVAKYLVEWRSAGGHMVSGIMKVFESGSAHRWRNEVNALSKLCPDGHPALAHYLWESCSNSFTAGICTFTGDVVSPDSSVICRADYPEGTLRQFLDNHVAHLTEVGLHKIMLDVAAGLDFLHQRRLVHNALTTHTIFMASISEKVGIRVVIGDFEHSYEVPEDVGEMLKRQHCSDGIPKDNTEWNVFTIAGRLRSSGLGDNNNLFAPDIRSFSLVVLEIVVAMSEHNYKVRAAQRDTPQLQRQPGPPVRDRQRTISPERRLPAAHPKHKYMVEPDLPSVISLGPPPAERLLVNNTPSSTDHHHDHDGISRCSCSSRVTEIRVRSDAESHNAGECGSPHYANIKCQNPPSTPVLDLVGKGQSDVKFGGRCSSFEPCKSSSGFTESIQSRELPAIPASSDSDTDAMSLANIAIQTEQTAIMRSQINSELHQNRPQEPLSSLFHNVQTDSSSANSVHEDMQITPESTTSGSLESPDTSEMIVLQGVTAGSSEDSSPREEVHSISASLGSFDTIYEDEEHERNDGEPPSAYTKTHNGRRGQKASHKRRLPPLMLERGFEHGQRAVRPKRFSSASMDDGSGSLASLDSGLGSSHYDVRSERSNLSFHNVPGARSTVYSQSIEEDRFSLVRDYIDRSQPGTPVCPSITSSTTNPSLSGMEDFFKRSKTMPDIVCKNQTNNERVSAQKSLKTEEVEEEDEEEDVEAFPDLRLRKKPCVKHHPGMSCPHHMPPVFNPLFPGTTGKQEKTEVHVHADPVYEKIAQKNKLRKQAEESTEMVSIGTNTSDFESHRSVRTDTSFHFPDFSKQHGSSNGSIVDNSDNSVSHYSRNKRQMNALPKLGISGVRGRRMSDTSLGSSNPSRSPSATVVLEGCGGITPADSGISGMSPEGRSISSHAPSSVSPLSPVPRSANSSVLSLLQDTRLLETMYTAKMEPHTGMPHKDSKKGGSPSETRSGVGPNQLDYCQQLSDQHPQLKHTALLSSSQKRLRTMLNTLRKKGHLGFTAGQLLPVLSDCWLEDPAPSADEILRRLDALLPTAVV